MSEIVILLAVGVGSYMIYQIARKTKEGSTDSDKDVFGPQPAADFRILASELRKGSRGPDVKALQLSLKMLGYFNEAIDGLYGPVTADAVKKYQAANGLLVDGVAGAQTFMALDFAMRERGGSVTWG